MSREKRFQEVQGSLVKLFHLIEVPSHLLPLIQSPIMPLPTPNEMKWRKMYSWCTKLFWFSMNILFCNILASITRQQFKVKFFIIIDQFLVQSYINKFFFFFFGCSPMEWAHQIPPTSDAYLFAKVMFQYLVPICLSPQNK